MSNVVNMPNKDILDIRNPKVITLSTVAFSCSDCVSTITNITIKNEKIWRKSIQDAIELIEYEQYEMTPFRVVLESVLMYLMSIGLDCTSYENTMSIMVNKKLLNDQMKDIKLIT